MQVLKAAGTNTVAGGNWSEVFGKNADEFFNAWSIARFIGQVASAGKKEYALPLYVNVALRDPIDPGSASTYESGGATDNVLWIWKAAAPAIDLLAPDIYQNDSVRYRKVLELYARTNNPLFVPETRGTGSLARMCFVALGNRAIGWSPFGLDYTDFASEPFGTAKQNEASLYQVALNFGMIGPIMRQVARLNFEGKLQAVAEEQGEATQTMDFGAWKAVVTYGDSRRGSDGVPLGNYEPIGRALVAEISDDDFLVAGAFCRVDFKSGFRQAA